MASKVAGATQEWAALHLGQPRMVTGQHLGLLVAEEGGRDSELGPGRHGGVLDWAPP